MLKSFRKINVTYGLVVINFSEYSHSKQPIRKLYQMLQGGWVAKRFKLLASDIKPNINDLGKSPDNHF